MAADHRSVSMPNISVTERRFLNLAAVGILALIVGLIALTIVEMNS
jgi:hypothetical protein